MEQTKQPFPSILSAAMLAALARAVATVSLAILAAEYRRQNEE